MTQHQQHGGHHGGPTATGSTSQYVDQKNPQHNVTAAQLEKALGAQDYADGFYVRVAVFDTSGNITNGSNVTETNLKGLDTAQGINSLRDCIQAMAASPLNGEPSAMQIADNSGEWSWVSDVLQNSAAQGVS